MDTKQLEEILESRIRVLREELRDQSGATRWMTEARIDEIHRTIEIWSPWHSRHNSMS